MKVVIWMSFIFLTVSCKEDLPSVNEGRPEESKIEEREDLLRGWWGYPNFNFRFDGANITVVKEGEFDADYSGQYFIGEDGAGFLRGSDRKFFIEMAKDSQLTIMFDDGFGGADLPLYKPAPKN